MLHLLMRRCLGAHRPCGGEQLLATCEADAAAVELAHGTSHLSAHTAHVLAHLRVMVVLSQRESALRANAGLGLRLVVLVDPVRALLAVGSVLDLAVFHGEDGLDLALRALMVAAVVRAAARGASILLATCDLAALRACGAQLVRAAREVWLLLRARE